MHPRARRPVPPRCAFQAGALPRQVQGLRLTAGSHPRLDALVARARLRAGVEPRPLGVIYPCDALALAAAERVAAAGIARPVLIGPTARIEAAAAAAGIDAQRFERVATIDNAAEAARRGVALAREGAVFALMKGSLHTDELMVAVIERRTGLRGDSRISHAFLFDLPRLPKLLALADCVVNVAPSLPTKRAILGNAVDLLQRLGVTAPKVGIVTAVETVNPAIPATMQADALVKMSREGAWPGAIVEGPLGFDNAISAEAARIKGMSSQVAGDADLLVVPDLNAGNLLYKSFIYVGGGECAGVVLGVRVPVVLTSRADSLVSRVASVALAVLTAREESEVGDGG